MSEQSDVLTAFTTDDGVMVWGSTDSLAQLDEQPGLITRHVDTAALASRISSATALSSGIMASSGRWLKLTKESAEYLRNSGVKNVTTGVIRARDKAGGIGTQTAKWLRFEPPSTLSPDVVAQLSAYAQQKAIEQSLEEIKEYLEEIDQKLDQLIKSRKDERAAALDGITMAIHEAERIHEITGHVSDITWSKVQQNAQTLIDVQALAIRSLATVASDVRACRQDISKTAKTLERATEESRYWLGLLARAIEIQDRQYLIELARVEDADPSELDAHRKGITVARGERLERIGEALKQIQTSVNEGATLTNLGYVTNPFNSKHLTKGAQDVHTEVATFAEHTDISLDGLELLESKKWTHALRGLATDTVSKVQKAGNTGVEFVVGTVETLSDKVDDAVIQRKEAKAASLLAEVEKRKSARENRDSE